MATIVTIVVSVIIIIGIASYAAISYYGNGPTTITCSESTSTFTVMQNDTIQAISFAIPAQQCIHHLALNGFSLSIVNNKGLLEGTVSVNSGSPLDGLIIYLNGTYELYSPLSISNVRQYSMEYTTDLSNQTISIIAGKSYLIEFVGLFRDGTASTASIVVNAS
jgi:cell division protein YceG involved in septum cleavage